MKYHLELIMAPCKMKNAAGRYHTFAIAFWVRESKPMLLFRVQSKLTYGYPPILRPNSVSMIGEFLLRSSPSYSKEFEAVSLAGGDGTSRGDWAW
jgi:hypothetical protein